MSYQDRYKGRKIKDPPSLMRFVLFFVVGAIFAGWVSTLKGFDSYICALATLIMVALKLIFELITTRTRYKLPEKIADLPIALWLMFWLIPVPALWLVLRKLWPVSVDPNGPISVLTVICLALYVPTIMAVAAPAKKKEEPQKDSDSK
ncbi:MAG: hypothetical protein IAF58_02010 [Leptolyngbya sp.]|nr:hypothetical protein [Candidatus Melainabacteria bacterium]